MKGNINSETQIMPYHETNQYATLLPALNTEKPRKLIKIEQHLFTTSLKKVISKLCDNDNRK
uniref:CSON000683 protein n=1 Tax=Culicoides sonorensis TaxID=179676 RepID=A0A336K487_CULSO